MGAVEDEIVAVDLVLVVVFLAILPLPFDAADAAAALARVKRIDPPFSSFSLLIARCLNVRACYKNQPFCSITANMDVDVDVNGCCVGGGEDYSRSLWRVLTGGIFLISWIKFMGLA